MASWISQIGNVFQDERLYNETYMEEMHCKSDQIQQKNIELVYITLPCAQLTRLGQLIPVQSGA